MALLKALCWGLIFIIRIRFPPGTSLAMVDKTIECCEQLVSVDAVEHLLPVFSRKNATVIFDTVKRFSS